MGLGKMSYDEALGCADRLQKNAEDLRLHLTTLKTEMDSLNEVLKSRGADQIAVTYALIDSDMEKCPDKILGFNAYIRDAVNKYRADDEKLAQEGK
jgi:hypothetical protein